MNTIQFIWDEKKALSNKSKHKVSFEEARDSFYDQYGERFWNENNSEEEDRFLWLGQSFVGRILMVVHCYRENNETIRIISARKATKKEQGEYRGPK